MPAFIRNIGVVKSLFAIPAAFSNSFTASSVRPEFHQRIALVAHGHDAQHIVAQVGLLVVGEGGLVIALLHVDGAEVIVGQLAARGSTEVGSDAEEAGPLVVAVHGLVQGIDTEVVLGLPDQLRGLLGLGLGTNFL